jgi:hypothetical protein
VQLASILPMALSTNLRSLFKFEKARIAFGQAWKLAPPEGRGDGHQVRITKSFVGNELFHCSYGRDSEYGAQGVPVCTTVGDGSRLARNVNAGYVSAQMGGHSNYSDGQEFHWQTEKRGNLLRGTARSKVRIPSEADHYTGRNTEQ